MESYKELYEKAQKEKTTKQITAEYVKFEKAGDYVLGRFLSSNTQVSSLNNSEYKQYLFETDTGPVKFSLGAGIDTDAAALMKRGGIYYIEFRGREKTSSGYQVKEFTIEQIPDGEGRVVDPAELDWLEDTEGKA